MKTIKLKFVGFYRSLKPQELYLWKVLEKYFDVVLDDNPDYIICGCFDTKMSFVKYPQVRIFLTGENFAPDFNLVDYAISSYPIQFLDRVIYMPQFMEGYEGNRKLFFRNPRNYDESWLKTKTRFCNFIYGHDSEHKLRSWFYKKLSDYKQVDSPGRFLNNTKNIKVNWKNDSKINFQKTCKFSICFESNSHGGFITEKLMDAFYSETIPIYYGDPYISNIFNSKAFINCNDYENFYDVVEKIKQLDNDDEAFLAMMNEPIFNDSEFIDKKLDEYEKFVYSIFSQPIEKAYRRARIFWPAGYEDTLKQNIKFSPIVKFIDKISLPIRKVIAKIRGR